MWTTARRGEDDPEPVACDSSSGSSKRVLILLKVLRKGRKFHGFKSYSKVKIVGRRGGRARDSKMEARKQRRAGTRPIKGDLGKKHRGNRGTKSRREKCQMLWTKTRRKGVGTTSWKHRRLRERLKGTSFERSGVNASGGLRSSLGEKE